MSLRYKGAVISATPPTTSGTAYTGVATGVWSLRQQFQAQGNSLWPKGITVPGAPTIGTATLGNTQATVAFTAPADTGGTAITTYTATSSPGSVTGTASSSPITVTGLTNGTAYTFTVTATNAQGTGAASAASNSVTPSAGKTVQIKIWGAGGAGGNYSTSNGEYGGPGGYATATFTVAASTTLSIVVGAGGLQGGDGNPDGVGVPNGGGSRLTDSGYWSGGGGGLCAVFVGSVSYSDVTSSSAGLASQALIMAGSGGGGGYYVNSNGGGYGGGTSGGAGMNRIGGSSGGNGGGGATTGGVAGDGSGGQAGSFLKGGTNTVANSDSGITSGGGGAGWYGGGSGGNSNYGGGGGGGSGMVASVTSGTSLPSGVSAVTGNSYTTQTGTGLTAPNNSDSDYVSGRGVGGTSGTTSGNGGNGLIVIYVDGTKYSYNASASVQTLTV